MSLCHRVSVFLLDIDFSIEDWIGSLTCRSWISIKKWLILKKGLLFNLVQGFLDPIEVAQKTNVFILFRRQLKPGECEHPKPASLPKGS
jgi:hypothetical protein